MVCKSPFGDLYLIDEFFAVVVFSCIFKKIEEIEREFVPFFFVRVINFAGGLRSSSTYGESKSCLYVP